MSTFVKRPATPVAAAPDPSKHVNFTLGMVLGVDDFKQEFAYHNGRDQWLARDLLGYGTVSGLQVTVTNEAGKSKIEVSPGVAVSPLGQLIRVCSAQCAYLNDWLALHKNDIPSSLLSPPESPLEDTLKLYVVLCYRECPTDSVPIPGEPCRSEDDATAPSRLKDDYLLDLRLSPPDQREEDALRDFVLWLSAVEISDAGSSSLTLEQFLDEVRRAAHLPGSPPNAPLGSPPDLPPDFMFGSPPASMHIATGDAAEYLRAAFRVWVTELRPLWRPPGLGKFCGCREQAPGDDPPPEECLLLAEMDVMLDGDLQISDPTLVHINQGRRPYLLHMRLLQEWVLSRERPTAISAPVGNLVGDVTGNPGSNTLSAIQGNPVVKPIAGLHPNDVLTFNGSTWQGAPLPAALPLTDDLGSDLSGKLLTARIEKIQGVPVTIGPPQDGQILTAMGGTLRLSPPATPGPLPVGKDLERVTNNAKVVGIQDFPVNMAGAANGNVLTFHANEWKVDPVPAAPPPVGNFVEHPPGLPKFVIVAAGIVRGDESSRTPVYNGLKASATANSQLEIRFNGYRPPPNTGSFQYIVKVLPVVDEQLPVLVVNFVRFADAIILRVTLANGNLIEAPTLRQREFMIEISQFFA